MLDSPLSRTFASTSIAERDRNDHSLRERAFGDAEAIGFIKKRFKARSAANAATVPKNRHSGRPASLPRRRPGLCLRSHRRRAAAGRDPATACEPTS